MEKFKKNFAVSLGLLAAFGLWTVAVCFVDVQTIGPQGSSVGFATINQFVHRLTGVHFLLYTITDWLGLIPIGVCLGFAVLGFIQLCKTKSFLKVDHSLLVLGGFYIVTIAAYVLFEIFVVNFRPVLINGYLEASYPSSTTMLVTCVMPTAMMQLNDQIKGHTFKVCINFVITAFIAFMVIGRLISGVHWVTDIIGGILLSSGLVMMYHSFISLVQK